MIRKGKRRGEPMCCLRKRAETEAENHKATKKAMKGQALEAASQVFKRDEVRKWWPSRFRGLGILKETVGVSKQKDD